MTLKLEACALFFPTSRLEATWLLMNKLMATNKWMMVTVDSYISLTASIECAKMEAKFLHYYLLAMFDAPDMIPQYIAHIPPILKRMRTKTTYTLPWTKYYR